MTTNTKFADIKEVLAAVRKHGDAEGKGTSSRAEFVIDVAIAAAEGAVSDNAGTAGNPSDAEKLWDAFRSASTKKAGDVVTAEKSRKQRISNVFQVIKAAAIVGVNLADTLEDAKPVIKKAKDEGVTKSNTFDAMIDIARAQIKKGNSDLTSDEVLSAISPKTKDKARDEVSELEKLVKQMKVVRDGTEGKDGEPGKEPFPSDALTSAIEVLEERVSLLKLEASNTMLAAARAAHTANYMRGK